MTSTDTMPAPSGAGIVVSLDPGGTTGIVVADRSNPLDPETVSQIGPHQHHAELYSILSWVCPEVIVCESFDYRKATRDRVDLISREYIGVVNLHCQQTNTRLFMQTASKAKRFVTDSKLKALDMYYPGMPHSNDAARHLIYYFVVKEGLRSEIAQHWSIQ